jgi:hypothetical protein
MRDFMTACDCCLSDCSDGSRSLGDEDCGQVVNVSTLI